MSKNLLLRIAVAVVAIPAILWISYKGGNWLFGMVFVFAVVAGYEYLQAEGYRFRSLLFWLGTLTIISSLSMTHEVTGYFPDWLVLLLSAFPGVMVFFMLTAMLFATGTEPPPELFTKHARLLWGIFYISLLYPFVYVLGIKSTPFNNYGTVGGDWLLFLFALLWVGDTAAMAVGRSIGKRKLAPAVSPNKTVEGFIGGLVGAALVGLIMYFWKFREVPVYHMLLMSIGASIVGQLGDLVESMWKRSRGLKDSSSIIPGHGGVLDRFDSLLFAAPFLYYYKSLLIMP